MALRFNLDGFHNRFATDWHRDAPIKGSLRMIPRGGFRSLARKHAMKHGAAGAWRADDSFILFYREGNRVRQRTFKHAVPV